MRPDYTTHLISSFLFFFPVLFPSSLIAFLFLFYFPLFSFRLPSTYFTFPLFAVHLLIIPSPLPVLSHLSLLPCFLSLFSYFVIPFSSPCLLFYNLIIRFPPLLYSFLSSLRLSSLLPCFLYLISLFHYSRFFSLPAIFHFRFASYLFFLSHFLASLLSLLLPWLSSMFIFLLFLTYLIV